MKKSVTVRINPGRISRAAMVSAGEILRRGGLVVYPTETVYGLGANAMDGSAIEKVFQVKGRSADKPVIVLARNLSQLRELVEEIPPWARALMGRFWPDGLTLILPASPAAPRELLGGGGALAVRISGHPVVRALLGAARIPLTSSSANLSGHPSPTHIEDVQREMSGRVDLIIDGGETPGAIPSTILDVRAQPVRLIRDGRVPLQEIRKLVPVEQDSTARASSGTTVLVVCTGNTCRSAMAQGLLQKMFSSRRIGGIRILSAGTQAHEGERASALAQEVARDEDGIDLSGHRARRLTRQLLEAADLVLTMSLSQARHIEAMGKEYAKKTYLLTSFSRSSHHHPDDIEDPMGRTREVYGQVYGHIRDQLEQIFPALVKRVGGRDE